MKKLLLLVLCTAALYLMSGKICGQEPKPFTGRVTDKSTGLPVTFAQVSLTNGTMGSVTNADGFFELSSSSIHPDDSIRVYSFGYESVTIIAGNLQTNGTIELVPAIVRLKEVEVTGMTVENVIRHAVSAIPENYGKDPLLLTSFIRVRKMVSNKLAEYTEAVVDDQKDGYYLYPKKKLAEKHRISNVPNLVKGRVVSDTNLVNSLGDAGKNAFCMSCLFSKDIIEFYPGTVLDDKEFKYYDYHMEEITGPDGRKLYHIIFDQKDKIKESLWRGEIYITALDFAIEKIILKPSLKGYERYNNKTKFQRLFTIRNTPGWIQEMPMGETVLTYSTRQGRWYLNTIRNEYWLTYSHPPTGQHLKYSYLDELVVTDVTRDPEKLNNFRGSKAITPNQRWDQMVGKEDEEFWRNYNYVPIEQSIREDLKTLSH
jgi:hypothetical protein